MSSDSVRTLGGHRSVILVAAVLVAVAAFGPIATRPAGAAGWWAPPLKAQPWQWELNHPLRLTNAKDMGTKDKTPTGQIGVAPVIYDIDGIINPASTVAALHAEGKHVVCYIEVGAAGNYYSAGDEGIGTTYYDQLREADQFGSKVGGWPEYYLNINSPETFSIIESMIATQCAAKGFDAVETDIDEEYNDNSGFPISLTDQERYMTTLANYMHGLGLGWWIKNPDDTGSSAYATAMYPLADAVLTEQCNQYQSCGNLSAYFGHKAVFDAEYKGKPASFCPADAYLGFNGARFNVGLTGTRKPCI
jgi:hypothetical protein